MSCTRFAPSPTGLLHLGHAYSALFAARAASETRGRFLLRIEDIDPVRCKASFIDGIYEDLHWLGLRWEEPVRRQSEHLAAYAQALDKLRGLGVLYPCFCTRKEVEAESAASGHAPHGIDGPLYPGTCKTLSAEERAERGETKACVWRLDAVRALDLTGPLSWTDREEGCFIVDPAQFGDVVLARKDVPTSYHLSVTHDDALQGVSLVTRGKDLLQATAVHRLVQALLGYPQPLYHHHALMLDDQGQRFAKRHQSVTLKSLRDSGVTAAEIRQKLGF